MDKAGQQEHRVSLYLTKCRSHTTMQYQNFSGKFESWYLALQQLEVDNSRLDELGIQLKYRFGQTEQQTEVINPR